MIEQLNNIDILSFMAAMIAIFISIKALNIRKDAIALSMQSGFSAAVKSYIEISAKKHDYQSRREKIFYKRITKQTKIEILNQLEYACKSYLDCRIDSKSFEDYYKDIILKWGIKIDVIQASNNKDVYKNLRIVFDMFENNETHSRCFSECYTYILASIIYFILIGNYIYYNLVS